MSPKPILLSAVILAKTDSDANFQMTLDCIATLRESEKDVEIIIVESNKKIESTNYSYPEFVKFTMPEPDFNFHKFLNIGIRNASGQYIALLNNDLVFDKSWFREVLKVAKQRPDIASFSPPYDPTKSYAKPYEIGYKVMTHLNGWCIVARKEIFPRIGMLDETFDFNYADNDYAMTLKKYNIKHAVVNNAKVVHLENERDGKGEWYERERQKAEQALTTLRDNSKKISNHNVPSDPKSLNDWIKFHKKWGSPKKLHRKNKIADMLLRYNLGFLNRIVLSI